MSVWRICRGEGNGGPNQSIRAPLGMILCLAPSKRPPPPCLPGSDSLSRTLHAPQEGPWETSLLPSERSCLVYTGCAGSKTLNRGPDPEPQGQQWASREPPAGAPSRARLPAGQTTPMASCHCAAWVTKSFLPPHTPTCLPLYCPRSVGSGSCRDKTRHERAERGREARGVEDASGSGPSLPACLAGRVRADFQDAKPFPFGRRWSTLRGKI